MDRETLNFYLDAFFAMSTKDEDPRSVLIEEAYFSDSLLDLIQRWFWLENLDETYALKLKVWFSLTYEETSEVFGLSAREIGQIIRNQRTMALPPYRQEHDDSTPLAGISCFMLEQHLSAWIDGEIGEDRTLEAIHLHLQDCVACHHRLQQYRNLQRTILSERKSISAVSDEEWKKTITEARSSKRRQFMKWGMSLMIFIAISGFLAWVVWSKPEKMPNIYEIRD